MGGGHREALRHLWQRQASPAGEAIPSAPVVSCAPVSHVELGEVESMTALTGSRMQQSVGMACSFPVFFIFLKI